MAEKEGDCYRPWWAIDRAAWREKLSPFYKLGTVTSYRQASKPWTESDVNEFIHSDPLYGPQLLSVRKGAKIATTGAVIGGVLTAGISIRYSRSPHGAVLSLVAGSVVGWTVGEEVANLVYGLHRFDRMETNLKFFEWWKQKTEG